MHGRMQGMFMELARVFATTVPKVTHTCTHCIFFLMHFLSLHDNVMSHNDDVVNSSCNDLWRASSSSSSSSWLGSLWGLTGVVLEITQSPLVTERAEHWIHGIWKTCQRWINYDWRPLSTVVKCWIAGETNVQRAAEAQASVRLGNVAPDVQ